MGFIYQTDRNRTDEVLQGFIKKSQETPKHLLELAKWTLMVNNVSAAKQQLKEIADNKNFKPDVRTEADLLLANIYFEQGDYKATSEAVQAILNKNPNQIGAKILKAKVLIQDGQFEEASALLNTVLWDMPNSDEAIVLMGNIFLQQGELDKAQKNFKEALDINPANLQALFPVVDKAVKENHLDYAAQLLTKALARMPNQVSVLNKLVQIKMVQRDWETAEELISAMESQPKSIFLAKFLRGKLYQEQGDCSKAIPLFKETLSRYPAQADSLTEMARCHEMLKQRPKMLTYLNDLIKDSPANISAIVLKSKLLTLDRKFDDAVTLLTKAIDDYPNSVSLYSELARAYSQKNQIKDALRIYQLGLERNPESLELSMLLAATYVDQKKYDEAVAIYYQVIEKSPKLDIARNNLAAILLDHYGQPDDIEKAVQIVQRFKYSDQPYFIDTYAWAEFKAGRLNQALSILQKVIVAAPDVPVFRYHLASVYHALGNKSAALSELRQVMELAKSNQFDQLDDAKKLMRQLSGKSE
ncbi:tetratricopeptide repeat protein [Methylotuvimicrobium buryatense]|uniref:tetratricopeptide repeat protein n=1 Tax=Methylotuvimicrobium buryatense TaxID=95641 RepID=UPI001181B19F|nr:tetratricopeptide repeat protein [Methylotuvimicrobium buryatense]